MGIFCHQLCIGTGSKHREKQCYEQGHPYCATYLPRNCPGKSINARAENITENKQKKHRAGNGAAQGGLGGQGLHIQRPGLRLRQPIIGLMARWLHSQTMEICA